MNPNIDATAHDADALALALEGRKHLQRQARAIAAAMRKQEKRIRELETALTKCSGFLSNWQDCLSGVQMTSEYFHSASGLDEARALLNPQPAGEQS